LQLDPPDFHAIFEVYIENDWWLIHERRESFARSHRHPTGSAFLLDAQPVARNVEHPHGKSRCKRAADLIADIAQALDAQ
jgi:hypothetical protein